MPAPRYVSVRDWASQFSARGSGPYSIHFSEVSGLVWPLANVQALAVATSEILNEAWEGVTSVSGGRDGALVPMLAFPLGVSTSIVPWVETWWSSIGREEEPPSIYLIDRRTPFELDDEEYRCPVSPRDCSFELLFVYRCFRSKSARQRGWEFSRVLYGFRQKDLI